MFKVLYKYVILVNWNIVWFDVCSFLNNDWWEWVSEWVKDLSKFFGWLNLYVFRIIMYECKICEILVEIWLVKIMEMFISVLKRG